VKSLMADLSDDPMAVDTEEDLEALLTIPDVEDVTAADDNDDIMSEILDMTLEDELKNHPEDLAALEDLVSDEALADSEALTSLDDVLGAEQENIAENADIAAELSDEIMTVGDSPSLSEIAEAAEADAVAVETATMATAAATAGVGAVAAMAAVATNTSDEIPDVNQTVSQAEQAETITEPFSNQETPMPVKAVKSDAILDDVTEAATAGAFAELNQIVEDKAVFNERGPRIGDLVQDALRPMLKEWLDANLKGIVERAVTKEVKRISSGK